MTKEKSTFDSISPKLIIGQLYKSVNTMRIVSLKTQSDNVRKTCRDYNRVVVDLVDALAELHFSIINKKEIDEIPTARYVDPLMHLSDVIYYLEGQSKLFKSQAEQLVISEILTQMYTAKYRLSLS